MRGGASPHCALLAALPAHAVNYAGTTPRRQLERGDQLDAERCAERDTDTATITLAGTYTVTIDGDFIVKTVTLGGATGTQTLRCRRRAR